MASVLKPTDAAQVLEVLQWAVGHETALELAGAGGKRGFGRPLVLEHQLALSALSGISLYEPDELVLTAGPGTTMREIEGLLSQHRQALAFEPPDLGPLYGADAGLQTLGGVIACNLSGPRRIKAGAARDHVLGIKGVSGRGEAFKSGGRVVKNVTGYDLPKLLTGSFGTLAALTEITVKVLPAPEKTRTVMVYGLSIDGGVRALAQAASSPHEVAGLAHLPAPVARRCEVPYVGDAGQAVTAIRVEGPSPSVDHRCAELKALLASSGAVEELHSMNSGAFWREVRDVAGLLPDPGHALWRLSVTPSEAPAVLARLPEALREEVYLDWAGGLIWLAVPEGDDGAAGEVRAAVQADGHATLLRASDDVRRAVPVFQPQPAPLAALSERVRRAFDPLHLLNPGRMYAVGAEG